ncbi:MAG: hypothetical protein AVDCRST_MAG72-2504, partial [uncultured Nocardioidaceae bacterium]
AEPGPGRRGLGRRREGFAVSAGTVRRGRRAGPSRHLSV